MTYTATPQAPENPALDKPLRWFIGMQEDLRCNSDTSARKQNSTLLFYCHPVECTSAWAKKNVQKTSENRSAKEGTHPSLMKDLSNPSAWKQNKQNTKKWHSQEELHFSYSLKLPQEPYREDWSCAALIKKGEREILYIPDTAGQVNTINHLGFTVAFRDHLLGKTDSTSTCYFDPACIASAATPNFSCSYLIGKENKAS